MQQINGVLLRYMKVKQLHPNKLRLEVIIKLFFPQLFAAAQKGRTQLCSLLLAHGADPFMKNQENQTPIELASAEDVKCLLQDAMTISISNQSITSTNGLVCGLNSSNQNQSILVSPSTETETVTLPTGASMTLAVPVPLTPSRSCLSPAQGAESHADGTCCEPNESDSVSSVASFLIRYVYCSIMLWNAIK